MLNNNELSLAIFYNFKDEQFCPFCKMVKTLFDKGGSKLVYERLGLLNSDEYQHDFQKCFIHNYWLIDTYKDKTKQRPIKLVIDEGFEVFKNLKKIMCFK